MCLNHQDRQEAGIVVQCVKQLFATLTPHIGGFVPELAALFLIYLLVNDSEKSAEDVPSIRTPTTCWRDPAEAPGFNEAYP